MSFFAYRSNKELSYAEAQEIVSNNILHFDYLRGRVMKLDLSGDELDPYLYDRDNGSDSVLRVVSMLVTNAPNAMHETEIVSPLFTRAFHS